MKVKMVKFISKDGKDPSRPIVVIHGQAFYKSTGKNSHHKDTWFPFEGLSDKNIQDENDYRKKYAGLGHAIFIKPIRADNRYTFGKGGPFEAYIQQNLFERKKEIWTRFKDIDSMILSSILGGGFWEENDNARLLKSMLQNDYPQIYKKYNKITLSENPTKSYNDDCVAELNRWIDKQCAKAKVTLKDTLKSRFNRFKKENRHNENAPSFKKETEKRETKRHRKF